MPADAVTVSATFAKLPDYVCDFAAEQALIAAGTVNKPANVGGNQNLGQGFYGWEKSDKTDSKRNDYKGYSIAEGSTLPVVNHLWRRSDRYDQDASWANAGGLTCPNDREYAIDGLKAGSKVVIEYDATNATEGNKEIIWAMGDGSSESLASRATATINGVEAVSGETAIASGAEIVVNTVTPAVKGTGYIVVKVKKGMIIKSIAIYDAEPYYAVNISNEITNGTVKANKPMTFVGDEVTLTATANDGYELEAITVTGVTSNVAVPVTNGKFIMPADDVTVNATFVEIPKFYIIGDMNSWDRTAMTEMTFNAETQAYEYEYAPTTTAYFAFADKQLTADEAAADEDWAIFNATNRYAIGENNVDATLNEAVALQKVNGTIVLKTVKEGTSYKISVAKDLSTVTITGEAAPEPELTYTVAGAFHVGEADQASFFGTAWDPTAAANDMEKQEDGTYKKVYENVSFTEIGQIQFKIVENHSWAVNYGWDGNNAFFDVTAPATNVTVTFTFDPNGATDQDKVKIVVKSASTAINGIDAEDADDNTPIYNLSGQKVTKSYKGVVIKNGKKYMQK